jgi:hypothetical protein
MIGVNMPGKMGLPLNGIMSNLLGNIWSAGIICLSAKISPLISFILGFNVNAIIILLYLIDLTSVSKNTGSRLAVYIAIDI